MTASMLFKILLALLFASTSTLSFRHSAVTKLKVGSRLGLFNFNNKKNDNLQRDIDEAKERQKDEQMRIQQEILNRRKNKSKMKEYFETREAERTKEESNAKQSLWAKTKNEVDPLTEWKKAKESGKIKPLGYEEPARDSSRLGLNIPIPVNPIGIPRYDAGERFDLRLPYAERGYEDPDADVMAKMGRAFSGLFGGGGKKTSDTSSNNDKSNEGTNTSSKKTKK